MTCQNASKGFVAHVRQRPENHVAKSALPAGEQHPNAAPRSTGATTAGHPTAGATRVGRASTLIGLPALPDPREDAARRLASIQVLIDLGADPMRTLRAVGAIARHESP